MDNLTHALSGALIARATAPRPRPGFTLPLRRRIVLGVIAASLPDLDYFVSFVSPYTYLLNHRGITHSLLMMPLWSLVCALLCAKLWRGGPGWRAYFGVFAWGIGIHIAGDWITSFGTMLLAPLSDHRFALASTFIIDLSLLGLLLAGVVACIAWRQSRAPAVVCLALVSTTIAFQSWQHRQAIDLGHAHARAQGMQGAKVSALPRPLSPFNWMVVVDDGNQLALAQVRLVAGKPLLSRVGIDFFNVLAAPYLPPSAAPWTQVDRFGPDPIAREAFAAPGFAFFRWFAAHPALYRIDRNGASTCVWFQDLRFLTPGRDVMPFRYGLCREGQGPWERFELDDENPDVPRRFVTNQDLRARTENRDDLRCPPYSALIRTA